MDAESLDVAVTDTVLRVILGFYDSIGDLDMSRFEISACFGYVGELDGHVTLVVSVQQPAHEMRILGKGYLDISTPILEMKEIAVKGFLSKPGIVRIKSRVVVNGETRRLISFSN